MNKTGFMVFMVVAGLIYSGCPTDSETGGSDAVVSALSLDGLITAPVKNTEPFNGWDDLGHRTQDRYHLWRQFCQIHRVSAESGRKRQRVLGRWTGRRNSDIP